MQYRTVPVLRWIWSARLVGIAAAGASLALGGCATSSGPYPYDWTAAPEYGHPYLYGPPLFYGIPDEGRHARVEREEEEREQESPQEEQREPPQQERQEEHAEHEHRG